MKPIDLLEDPDTPPPRPKKAREKNPLKPAPNLKKPRKKGQPKDGVHRRRNKRSTGGQWAQE